MSCLTPIENYFKQEGGDLQKLLAAVSVYGGQSTPNANTLVTQVYAELVQKKLLNEIKLEDSMMTKPSRKPRI